MNISGYWPWVCANSGTTMPVCKMPIFITHPCLRSIDRAGRPRSDRVEVKVSLFRSGQIVHVPQLLPLGQHEIADQFLWKDARDQRTVGKGLYRAAPVARDMRQVLIIGIPGDA